MGPSVETVAMRCRWAPILRTAHQCQYLWVCSERGSSMCDEMGDDKSFTHRAGAILGAFCVFARSLCGSGPRKDTRRVCDGMRSGMGLWEEPLWEEPMGGACGMSL